MESERVFFRGSPKKAGFELKLAGGFKDFCMFLPTN